MARDYNKAQTFYRIRIYFKHGTKEYKVTSKAALDAFLIKTHQNETVIHYIVEAHQVMVYAQYRFTGRE